MIPSPTNLTVAFAAGTASFFSPCVLPLIPGYLAVLSGISAQEQPVAKRVGGDGRRRLLTSAALFVAGFGAVFVALGMGSGLLGGRLLASRRVMEIVGGVLMVAFGLMMLSDRLVPARLQRRYGGPIGPIKIDAPRAFGLGAVFASAWSPCIGPTLGAIMALAASSRDAAAGAVLLAVFAAGLAVPLMVLAVGSERLLARVSRFGRHTRAVRAGAGVMIAAFGVLLAVGMIQSLSARLSAIPGLDL